jgi:hypothetical protein
MKLPSCSLCSADDIAMVVRFQGADLCGNCAEVVIERFKRDRRIEAACVAMSRVLVWVEMEALRQVKAPNVVDADLVEVTRSAALLHSLQIGRIALRFVR